MDAPLKTEKQIKRARLLDKISYLLIAILLCGSIFFGATVLFQKKYFHTTWVNGQSMYPTFNANAVDKNGKPKGYTGGSAKDGDRNLDLVIYDGHEHTMNSIERYDILIVSGDDTPEGPNYIKRLIVLPGETFYFGTGADNGELFIKVGEEFVKQQQPVDMNTIHAASYGEYTTPHTLKNDEYFVLGDNRCNSSDSRAFGPKRRELIKGVVVAIVGTCSAESSDTGVTYANIHYKWPRFIK